MRCPVLVKHTHGMFVTHKYALRCSPLYSPFQETADGALLSSPSLTPPLSQHTFPSHELCIWLIRLVITVYGQLEIPLCSSWNIKWTFVFFLPISVPSLSAVCYGWGGVACWAFPLCFSSSELLTKGWKWFTKAPNNCKWASRGFLTQRAYDVFVNYFPS